MNLTDLTTELHDRAVDSAPAPAVIRLARVQHRIRARRRQQRAAAAGLAALCVATIVLAPGRFGVSPDRPSTPATRQSPTPVPTPVSTNPPSGPMHFATDLGQDPLIAAEVSRPGADELILRFIPKDTNLAFSSFCRWPEAPAGDQEADDPETLTALMTINGKPVSEATCQADASANENTVTVDDNVKANEAGWAAKGVRAGVENVLRVQAVDQGRNTVPGTLRIGVGIYRMSGPRVVSDGVTLKQRIESGAHRYYLEKYRTMPATATRRTLALPVPDGVNGGLILGGLQETSGSDPHATGKLTVDNKTRVQFAGGATVSTPLRVGPHLTELRLAPGMTGMMVMAYYVDIG